MPIATGMPRRPAAAAALGCCAALPWPHALLPCSHPSCHARAGKAPEHPQYSWSSQLDEQLVGYLERMPLTIRLPAYQVLVVVSWAGL